MACNGRKEPRGAVIQLRIAETTLRKLTALQGYPRPNQIISLMTIDGQTKTLAMGDYDDYTHVDFPRLPHVPSSERPADIAKLVATFKAE